jgi:hypothetical protein
MRRYTQFFLILLLTVTFVASCSFRSGPRKKMGFQYIYPGMTRNEVVDTMGKGPSEAVNYEAGYVAWFYGKDKCVLLLEGEVVSKEVTQTKTNMSAFGLKAKERILAECAPPGQRSGTKEQSIKTPFGIFKQKK